MQRPRCYGLAGRTDSSFAVDGRIIVANNVDVKLQDQMFLIVAIHALPTRGLPFHLRKIPLQLCNRRLVDIDIPCHERIVLDVGSHVRSMLLVNLAKARHGNIQTLILLINGFFQPDMKLTSRRLFASRPVLGHRHAHAFLSAKRRQDALRHGVPTTDTVGPIGSVIVYVQGFVVQEQGQGKVLRQKIAEGIRRFHIESTPHRQGGRRRSTRLPSIWILVTPFGVQAFATRGTGKGILAIATVMERLHTMTGKKDVHSLGSGAG